MKQSMIVTNLRMPQTDYLQIKSLAGELGMSVNEYIQSIVTSSTTKYMMKKDKKQARATRKSFYKAILSLSNMKNTGKKYDLSKEDKIIYDI